MADLRFTTVKPKAGKFFGSSNANNTVQYCTNRITTQSVDADQYFHIKTNIPNRSDVMYLIEAVGYNYGAAQAIRCAWGGYMYNHQDWGIYNGCLHSPYPGMIAHGQYVSADNFLVIRGYRSYLYFTGFNLNVYQQNPVPITNFAVQTFVLNSNSGAHY
jgi:hypothetical protein